LVSGREVLVVFVEVEEEFVEVVQGSESVWRCSEKGALGIASILE
jgi:hypothetical protein